MSNGYVSDAALADELAAAEEALGYWNVGGINPDPDGALAERVILAQNAICERLDLPLDETEQGLTPKASEAIDAFVAEHRTTKGEG